MRAVFTVFFEAPFWVAILESEDADELVVARHVFGGEPTNAELLDFMLHHFHLMRRSSTPMASEASSLEASREGRANPKRAMRLAARESSRPPSTKAQAALSAAREAGKSESAASRREALLEAEEKRFRLRAEKRREKHRGH